MVEVAFLETRCGAALCNNKCRSAAWATANAVCGASLTVDAPLRRRAVPRFIDARGPRDCGKAMLRE